MRDKLIELIDNFVHNFDIKQWYSDELDEKLADYLIENITNWISVEDRLPCLIDKRISRGNHYKYNSERVLCVCEQESGKVMVKEGYYEIWNGSSEPIWKIPGSIDNVTHWQPLPEPPKGE